MNPPGFFPGGGAYWRPSVSLREERAPAAPAQPSQTSLVKEDVQRNKKKKALKWPSEAVSLPIEGIPRAEKTLVGLRVVTADDWDSK